MSYVIIGAIVALIAYIIMLYNKLVKNKQMVEEGWSGIDVQLKRRSNLIPNLIETVKGYAGHEKEVLEKVTQMRTKADQVSNDNVEKRAEAEGLLSGALANLFAVVENYPDLKANENFQSLQNELSEVEEQIQLARRYYNGTVRDNNILVDSFPSNIVAKQFKFIKAEYFEIENEAEKAVPKVEF